MSAGETKKGVAGLQSASGFIQSVLGKKLRIRQFPPEFKFDYSIRVGFDMVQKIEHIISDEHRDDEPDPVP